MFQALQSLLQLVLRSAITAGLGFFSTGASSQWRMLLLEQKKPYVVRSAGTTTTAGGLQACRQAVVRVNAGRGRVVVGWGARAVVGGAGGGGRRRAEAKVICLHTALDDMPAEGLSGQICPSPIVVILLKGVQTPLSEGRKEGGSVRSGHGMRPPCL